MFSCSEVLCKSELLSRATFSKHQLEEFSASIVLQILVFGGQYFIVWIARSSIKWANHWLVIEGRGNWGSRIKLTNCIDWDMGYAARWKALIIVFYLLMNFSGSNWCPVRGIRHDVEWQRHLNGPNGQLLLVWYIVWVAKAHKSYLETSIYTWWACKMLWLLHQLWLFEASNPKY